MLKLCKNCKHCDDKLTFCLRQKVIDLVDGDTKFKTIYCQSDRLSPWFIAWFMGECGEEGRYFEEQNNDS